MKKTYINPKMTVIEIKVQQLLAASDPAKSTEAVNSSDRLLSRDFDIEFDEDEDY